MKAILSIDIGSKNLHFAEGSYNKGGLVVQKAQTYPIPEGCMKDEFVENPTRLAETIRDCIKLGGFQAKEVILTLNSCNAIVRDMDLPTAKPKDLDKMIRTELKQTFNIITTDVIQYKLIEKVNSESGLPLNRYRVIAIDSDIVESFHVLLKSAKLKAIAMDINLNAIEKLFTNVNMVNERLIGDETIMLMDFGDIYTTLYFCTKGRPVFYRHIKLGSREIEKSISDETYTPISEIQALKESGYSFFSEEEAAKKYYALLKPFFYKFNDEIRKIMSFYSSRAGIPPVGYLYLFGQGSELEGLPAYFESNLNVPTEKIKSVSSINIGNAEQLLPANLNAIGALIRY